MIFLAISNSTSHWSHHQTIILLALQKKNPTPTTIRTCPLWKAAKGFMGCPVCPWTAKGLVGCPVCPWTAKGFTGCPFLPWTFCRGFQWPWSGEKLFTSKKNLQSFHGKKQKLGEAVSTTQHYKTKHLWNQMDRAPPKKNEMLHVTFPRGIVSICWSIYFLAWIFPKKIQPQHLKTVWCPTFGSSVDDSVFFFGRCPPTSWIQDLSLPLWDTLTLCAGWKMDPDCRCTSGWKWRYSSRPCWSTRG